MKGYQSAAADIQHLFKITQDQLIQTISSTESFRKDYEAYRATFFERMIGAEGAIKKLNRDEHEIAQLRARADRAERMASDAAQGAHDRIEAAKLDAAKRIYCAVQAVEKFTAPGLSMSRKKELISLLQKAK